MHIRAAVISDKQMLEGAAHLFCAERGLLGGDGAPLRPTADVLGQLLAHGVIDEDKNLRDEQFGYACYEYYRQTYAPGFFDRLLRQEAAGIGSIADIGCGAGATICMLLHDSPRNALVGIDQSREQIQLLQTLVEEQVMPHGDSVRVEIADACQLPLLKNTFDMVICRAALQYMDVEKALAEMHRILKPEGKLYVVVHGSGYGLDYVWRRRGWLKLRTFRIMGKGMVSMLHGPVHPVPNSYKAFRYITARHLQRSLSRAGFVSTCLHLDPSGQRLGSFPVYIGATGFKKGEVQM